MKVIVLYVVFSQPFYLIFMYSLSYYLKAIMLSFYSSILYNLNLKDRWK